MSVYDRLYVARLAPVDKGVTVFARDVGGEHSDILEKFERDCFSHHKDDPTKIAVILRHDDDEPVGHVVQLSRSNGWHVATFELDHSVNRSAVAADRLRVGSPVSIGFKRLHGRYDPGYAHHTIAELLEITVLGYGERPAIEGAEVIMVLDGEPVRAGRTPSKLPPRDVEPRVREDSDDGRGRVLQRSGIGCVLRVR